MIKKGIFMKPVHVASIAGAVAVIALENKILDGITYKMLKKTGENAKYTTGIPGDVYHITANKKLSSQEKDEVVKEQQNVAEMFGAVGRNDLKSFKKHLDTNKEKVLELNESNETNDLDKTNQSNEIDSKFFIQLFTVEILLFPFSLLFSFSSISLSYAT